MLITNVAYDWVSGGGATREAPPHSDNENALCLLRFCFSLSIFGSSHI